MVNVEWMANFFARRKNEKLKEKGNDENFEICLIMCWCAGMVLMSRNDEKCRNEFSCIISSHSSLFVFFCHPPEIHFEGHRKCPKDYQNSTFFLPFKSNLQLSFSQGIFFHSLLSSLLLLLLIIIMIIILLLLLFFISKMDIKNKKRDKKGNQNFLPKLRLEKRWTWQVVKVQLCDQLFSQDELENSFSWSRLK